MSYGFTLADNKVFGNRTHQEYHDNALGEDCISTFTVASICHLVYKVTELSYFGAISVASCGALSVCLARRSFHDYTFFHELEHLSIVICDRYRLLPVISLIVAGQFWSTLPLVSIGISFSAGMLSGFALRIKWLSHKMGR